MHVESFHGRKEIDMAADPKDVKDARTIDMFDTEEKQWIKVAMANQIKSLERMMAKYPVGSGAHTAHNKDVQMLRKIAEKF